MKIKIIFLFTVILSLLNSCTRKAKEFNVNDSTEFVIPSSISLFTPLSIAGKESKVNFEEEFENNNTRAKYLKEVRLEELKFTITSPPGKSFNFLKSVSIYLSTEGLPEVLLASKDNIENSGQLELFLQPSSENLIEYIKNDSYKIRCNAITDEAIFQDITIKGDIKFNIVSKAAIFR
ncbi:MAG: hypothetical protein H0V01_14515 [Bacteroidetes bacterium]|nr:hypothetical protein [Bacteroidota bacterium]HET6245049.1 hypothetical protein [Bacteroidia bacterium]